MERDRHLNSDKQIIRALGKTTDPKKLEQIKYGCKHGKPTILIVFDYSESSGLGTQNPHSISRLILKSVTGKYNMPTELSAIIYLDRYIKNGQFWLRTSSSTMFHNPLAKHKVDSRSFDWLTQFYLMEQSSKFDKDILII